MIRSTHTNGFRSQPSNFWQSYGAAARWQVINQNNWKLGISGSLESWEVGSGGDDSFDSAGDSATPNIFNDSDKRVFTRNIVGSLSFPVSWQANDHWQFSFNPGVSFLPATQGKDRWSWQVLWNQPLRWWRSPVPTFSRAWLNRKYCPTHREWYQQL